MQKQFIFNSTFVLTDLKISEKKKLPALKYASPEHQDLKVG